MADRQAFRAEVNAEIARLRHFAAASTVRCTAAKVIALADERVVELIVDRLEQDNVFRGVSCRAQDSVLVQFDCPHGRFCLLSPSFLVRVSVERRAVIAIIDPYDPTEAPSTEIVATRGFAPAMATTAEGATRTVTVTASGVSNIDFRIGGSPPLKFDGEGQAKADVVPGTYKCRWAVRGDPGDTFAITVEGAAKPVKLSSKIEDPQGEAGQFSITVA